MHIMYDFSWGIVGSKIYVESCLGSMSELLCADQDAGVSCRLASLVFMACGGLLCSLYACKH